MSSLLFLTTNDFTLDKVENVSILCHEIKGISFILFYSTQCVYCQQLIPIFKKLPDIINGCHFGMINVSMNKNLVQMSMETILPIRYVPILVLYVNGHPYMRYDGPPNENGIRRFILEASNSIQESGFTKISKEKGIPAYTIGNPLYGEGNVCYLEFDEAYDT